MKSYLIFGLKASGLGSLELLYNKKDKFYLYDDDSSVRESVFSHYISYPNIYCIKVLDDSIITQVDSIILSPAISIDDKRLSVAKRKGIDISSELDVGYRCAKGKIIAITGTNGKTTTTSLINHILQTAHKRTIACGNIGYPLSQAVKGRHFDYLVCETSSFQLESSKEFKPDVACLLNITPDHLDRHKSMRNYTSIKYSIFKNMTKHSFAVINNALPSPENFSGIVFKFSHKSQKKCIFDENGKIFFNNGKKIECIMPLSSIGLTGDYNLENVLCSILVAKLCHIKNKYIIRAVQTFKPRRHRLEQVYEIDGKSFFDDSKATNSDATKNAVLTLSKVKRVRLILGGSDKGENFDKLCHDIIGCVEWIYVTGANGDKIVSSLKKCHFTRFTQSAHFEDAVVSALKDIQMGDALLLSPASASFDEFKNYKERGERFLEIIKKFYEK